MRVYVYEGRAFMDENAAYKPKEKTEVARQCALQLRSFFVSLCGDWSQFLCLYLFIIGLLFQKDIQYFIHA